MIRRLHVGKRPGFDHHAQALACDWREQLGVGGLRAVHHFLRYDVEGLDDAVWAAACTTVLSEAAVELVYEPGAEPWPADAAVFAVEYLPGQFDQRADSARQCLQLLAPACDPQVACAEVFWLVGDLSAADVAAIRNYHINPVDSRPASLVLPGTLRHRLPDPAPVARLPALRGADPVGIVALHHELGLAMSVADLAFVQQHFIAEGRDPTVTEIRMLDTYWSDHCRHTTFLTAIEAVDIEESPYTAPIEAAWHSYLAARRAVFGAKADDRPISLMDIALIGMRHLRQVGKLPDLEESEEVNAASIVVPAVIDGRTEEWLVMFKNETHNHPTEIEPFGGAATCLGGAIRDPLSGRSYVYQAMRVTGAADPRVPLSATLPGKLPQRVITRGAARGYSSYGNQIGLATGMVREIYHPGYVAKRMEIGAVIAAAPRAMVQRGTPEPGDCIVLVGGPTGRDGIGGATGSSKAHTDTALQNAAEVQKGDAPMERKLQRLFRDPDVSRRIKRCNDFGAGGVAVAIGELAPSLDIDLDAVPLKYSGLDGTEIAISESQERMAVVLAPPDVEPFIAAAAAENLLAVRVATVTDSGRLRMTWRGDRIVDLARTFLDTNGVRQTATARITAPSTDDNPLDRCIGDLPLREDLPTIGAAWCAALGDLNLCSQQGLVEMFDSTVGNTTILHPFGGRERRTPGEAMASLLPVLNGETTTATLMSHGFNPTIAQWSPFHGAVYAIVEAVARLVAAGGDYRRARLTLQEYFERLRGEPQRWGKPLAALLGAWHAQEALGLPAIGGKDSMSGSFKDKDVPPTLVAFAVAPVDACHVLSPEFKQAGNQVFLVSIPRDDAGIPDWNCCHTAWQSIYQAITAGQVVSARSIREGGIAAALSEMTFGNHLGFEFHHPVDVADLFSRDYGALLLELAPGTDPASLPGEVIGEVLNGPTIQVNGEVIALDTLLAAWRTPLESIFPTHATEPPPLAQRPSFAGDTGRRSARRSARPRIIIPTFPGSNCEYDSARAFRVAGGEPQILVFRNRHRHDVEQSIAALATAITGSQILMIPGGFSAGDEPGGSGKFIAAVLRHPAVADAIMRLIRERDGLVLGICNGFQALIKTGLLPYGEVRTPTPDSPTLDHNAIGRHISCYVRTRVLSTLSPWMALCQPGDEHWIPMSHGEGAFTAPEPVLDQLFANQQIATQYCDAAGLATHRLPDNPNGSLQAIEGVCSPCGRVFGKMGHTERAGPWRAINIPGNKNQPLFEAGIRYFQ
jgi:phosphoribosylformylglycinamidine synthase